MFGNTKKSDLKNVCRTMMFLPWNNIHEKDAILLTANGLMRQEDIHVVDI